MNLPWRLLASGVLFFYWGRIVKKSEGLQAIEKPLASLPHAIGKHIFDHIQKLTHYEPVIGIMGKTGTQTDSVRKKSVIPANIPLFTLQGNFNVKKLHGIYRFMMEIMVKTVGKGLAEKSDRTPEENDMQDMMFRSGERVKAENLSAILDWYRAQQ